MSYCKKCGARLKSDSRFCQVCGEETKEVHQAKRGSENPEAGERKISFRDLKVLIPIIAVLIGGMFGIVQTMLPRVTGGVEIADVAVLYDPEYEGACILDFKVVNDSTQPVFITGVHLKVVSFEPLWSWSFHIESSYDYNLDISNLETEGDEIECKISQEVKPGCTDRFRVIAIAPDACGFWLLEAFFNYQ